MSVRIETTDLAVTAFGGAELLRKGRSRPGTSTLAASHSALAFNASSETVSMCVGLT